MCSSIRPQLPPCTIDCDKRGDYIIRYAGDKSPDEDLIYEAFREIHSRVIQRDDSKALWLPSSSRDEFWPYGSALVGCQCRFCPRLLAACLIQPNQNGTLYTLKSLLVSPTHRRQGLAVDIVRIAVNHCHHMHEAPVEAHVRLYGGRTPAPSAGVLAALNGSLKEVFSCDVLATDELKAHYGSTMPSVDSKGHIKLDFATFSLSPSSIGAKS